MNASIVTSRLIWKDIKQAGCPVGMIVKRDSRREITPVEENS